MNEGRVDEELFPAEFRHELVTKFIRGFLDGSIKTKKSFAIQGKDTHLKLTDLIADYCSGSLLPEEMNRIEDKLFRVISILRMHDGIDNGNLNVATVEHKIERLEERIESTNRLLAEVLVILKELMKRLGK